MQLKQSFFRRSQRSLNSNVGCPIEFEFYRVILTSFDPQCAVLLNLLDINCRSLSEMATECSSSGINQLNSITVFFLLVYSLCNTLSGIPRNIHELLRQLYVL